MKLPLNRVMNAERMPLLVLFALLGGALINTVGGADAREPGGLTGAARVEPPGAVSRPEGLGRAQWIAPPRNPQTTGPLPLFRKEFVVTSKTRNARLRIVGLGDYDARLNGQRLSDTGLNQPWSQYEKTLYYRDFDLGGLLQPGANCLGVMLGNSFWHNPNPPKGRYNKVGPQRQAPEPLLLCAELTWESADGSRHRLGTDATWRTQDGPVTFSHVYAGEDYDARRQVPGWDRAGFADTSWESARVADAPKARLAAQDWPPITVHERFAPASVKESAPGVFLYSFPQNCAAQLRVEIAVGKPGDKVSFRCGEHKNRQDRLFGGYVVNCEAVASGQPFRYEWIFFYLGQQYIEVTGAVPEGRENPQNLPVIRRLDLAVVRSALPEVGSFSCSSDLFNRTHRLIDWAMRGNLSFVMTDCPHREKLGWLECAYLLEPSFLYRYDGRQWFAKIARDIRDAQEPSGRVLTVAPSYPDRRFPSAFAWTVEWGAAAVLVPWQHYQWFGDAAILRENFDMMRRFTDSIGAEAKDGIAPGGLGDWYDYGHGQPPGPSRFTPPELSATAVWALCALSVAQAAEVLNLPAQVARYRELQARIAADFRRHFQDPATGRLRHQGSPQCANALALCAELVPQPERESLIQEIIADLEKRGWQQTPGDVGHVFFIRALAQAGRSDVLHQVYSRDGIGSYGGILRKGLTALPETWDAMMDGSQSLNHCMLGHVMEWFYAYVGGIRQPAGSVGWRKILIAPNPGPLTRAETTLQTPSGRVVSRWRRVRGQFRLEAEIPTGVEAMARLPSGKTQPLRAGKQVIVDQSEQALPH